MEWSEEKQTLSCRCKGCPSMQIYALLRPTLSTTSMLQHKSSLTTSLTFQFLLLPFSSKILFFNYCEIDFRSCDARVSKLKGFQVFCANCPLEWQKPLQPSARLPHRLKRQFLVLSLSRAFSQFKCLLPTELWRWGDVKGEKGNCVEWSQQGWMEIILTAGGLTQSPFSVCKHDTIASISFVICMTTTILFPITTLARSAQICCRLAIPSIKCLTSWRQLRKTATEWSWLIISSRALHSRQDGRQLISGDFAASLFREKSVVVEMMTRTAQRKLIENESESCLRGNTKKGQQQCSPGFTAINYQRSTQQLLQITRREMAGIGLWDTSKRHNKNKLLIHK